MIVSSNMIIKKILLLAFSFISLVFQECYSQGTWDMLYYPLDSLNDSFLEKEIRIDLKKTELDVYKDKTNIRRHFNTSDSAYVIIDKKKVLLKERWRIYTDHGVLGDQYLECIVSGRKKHALREIYLKSVDDNFLILEGNFYKISADGKFLLGKRKVFQVSKNVIKGFLTKIP